MSSTYDLVEEDFIHETPLSTSNIQDDDNIADPKIGPVTCCKKVCRILPTPVCRNILLCMRHERTCHLFNGLSKNVQFVVKSLQPVNLYGMQ
jgi:hypothetical protein